MNKTTRSSLFTYALVIVAFLIIQVLRGTVGIGSVLEGQLIPICAYVTMALALNLVVGVSGELSLGHAGFMAVGAYTGGIFLKSPPVDELLKAGNTAGCLPYIVAALLLSGIMAGIFGLIIGIPALRLKGDLFADIFGYDVVLAPQR